MFAVVFYLVFVVSDMVLVLESRSKGSNALPSGV